MEVGDERGNPASADGEEDVVIRRVSAACIPLFGLQHNRHPQRLMRPVQSASHWLPFLPPIFSVHACVALAQ